MKYTIIKPDFKDQKNYTKIPNWIFSDKGLTQFQKMTLLFLMSHKDGFGLTTEFIQKGLNLSNWLTVRNHIETLKEKDYISVSIDGKISINLEPKNTNPVSTNSKTTNQISTNSELETTKTETTQTTHPVSTNYSLNEDNTTKTEPINNKTQQEHKQEEKQEEKKTIFSSKFSDKEEIVLKLNSYYHSFLKEDFEKHNKYDFNFYEDFLIRILYDRKNDDGIVINSNSQICDIILKEELNYYNYSVYNYISSIAHHEDRMENQRSLIKKLSK